MRQFGNLSKKNLQWKSYNTAEIKPSKNNNCVVVIPIYKTSLSTVELSSLKQVVKTLGKNYDICLLHGKSLDISGIKNSVSYGFLELVCEDIFLSGRVYYSDMCEREEFYQSFKNYKYLLIYQLDAWIFNDKLSYFINLGYDYYGSIHSFIGHHQVVGNGGFSLRKISSFISVCNRNKGKNINIKATCPEDLMFTIGLASQLKICPFKIGLEFGFQNEPQILFTKNGNKLPMGCHAFEKCNYTWWKQYIKINGIEMEPLTISEKLNWLKLNDSNSLKTKCADKIKLHEYSIEKIGKDICVPILKVYNNPNEIKLEELPDKFVLKCNHGSGMNIVVTDKKKINLLSAINKIKTWLAKDYAATQGEKHYHDIQRKCYAETFLDNGEKEILDYKFWCFHGVPKFYTINGGGGHGAINYYDMQGNFIEGMSNIYCPNNPSAKYTQPEHFNELVKYAESLSSDFKFARVDFYDFEGKVYLGEITFIPGAGRVKYKDSSYNVKVGNMLDIHKEPKRVNKKVIYTCITGNYETPTPLSFRSYDFDYVCFTDNPDLKSDFWVIKQIPEKIKNLDNARKNRYIKLHPHEFFPNYDLSIYIDGNVDIKSDVNNYISQNCQISKGVIFIGQHPSRKCIYKEADIVVRIKKDTADNVSPQMERYRKEGFPENYGLTQNCIIIRYHKDADCIKLMETWWNEVNNYSHRDQLSLFYSVWKNNFTKFVILPKDIFSNAYFKWGITHKKTAKPTLAKQLPKLPHTTVISTDTEEKEDKKIEKVIDIISGGIHSEIKPKTHFRPQMKIRKSPSVAIKHFLNS